MSRVCVECRLTTSSAGLKKCYQCLTRGMDTPVVDQNIGKRLREVEAECEMLRERVRELEAAAPSSVICESLGGTVVAIFAGKIIGEYPTLREAHDALAASRKAHPGGRS